MKYLILLIEIEGGTWLGSDTTVWSIKFERKKWRKDGLKWCVPVYYYGKPIELSHKRVEKIKFIAVDEICWCFYTTRTWKHQSDEHAWIFGEGIKVALNHGTVRKKNWIHSYGCWMPEIDSCSCWMPGLTVMVAECLGLTVTVAECLKWFVECHKSIEQHLTSIRSCSMPSGHSATVSVIDHPAEWWLHVKHAQKHCTTFDTQTEK